MWEQNESDPFFFNDAGNNPTSAGETLSLRHAGIVNWYNTPSPGPKASGGAIVGTFSGVAQFVKWPKCYALINAPAASLVNVGNDLLNVGWR